MKFIRWVALLQSAGLTLFATAALAQGNGNGNPRPRFGANLQGKQEVPALLTAGRGGFNAKVTSDQAALDFTLRYSGLGTVTAAHIHIGQSGVNGGAAAFLCGGPAPPCIDVAGTIEGTIIAADVLDVAVQGVGANDFDALIRALRQDIGYVNVHTTAFPGGELRGQIRPGGGGGNGQGNGGGGGPGNSNGNGPPS